MKQQQQNDTGLYRQLRSAFDMTPEQMQRVREEIQQRAAGQDSALPVTGQSRFTGIRRITLRTALSAACLLLIAGGGIRLYQGLADNPLTQQSSVLVEEQLTCPTESGTGIAATSAPETTTAPETSRTTSSGQQTTTSGTTVTTTSQTAAETTQSADTTEATTTEETVTTTESAEQTTTTRPTTTTVTTTTTAVTTTTTAEPENTFEIVETPEQANIVIPDLTCAAGETVTVNVVLTEDMDVAGFQCDLLLNCPADAPAPTLLRRSTEIVQITGGQVIWNTPFPSVNPEVILVFGGENSTHLPAGIKLLSITYQIPEDAASGTVYRFSNDSLLLFAAKEPDFAIAARMYPGSITVG